MSDDGFAIAAIVRRWQDLIEIEDKYSNPKEEWIFRGDSCVRPLQPTLERMQVTGNPANRRKLESQLIADFRRSFRIHAPSRESSAKDEDILY
jgi:hypothetical protein